MSDFESFLRSQETPVGPDETEVIEVDHVAESAREAELEKREQSNYEKVAGLIAEATNIETIIDTLLNAPLPLKDAEGNEFNITKAAQALYGIRDDLAFRKFNGDESIKTAPRLINALPTGLGLKERISELYL